MHISVANFEFFDVIFQKEKSLKMVKFGSTKLMPIWFEKLSKLVILMIARPFSFLAEK